MLYKNTKIFGGFSYNAAYLSVGPNKMFHMGIRDKYVRALILSLVLGPVRVNPDLARVGPGVYNDMCVNML